jgi:hypothetical protein
MTEKEPTAAIREFTKDHPIIAIIVSIAIALGVPSGFGFMGASQGAQVLSDKLQNHEVRITTAERDIDALKKNKEKNDEIVSDIRDHMIRQTEQIATIQRDLAEIKNGKR